MTTCPNPPLNELGHVSEKPCRKFDKVVNIQIENTFIGEFAHIDSLTYSLICAFFHAEVKSCLSEVNILKC